MDAHQLLFGRDPTEGIVSVTADRAGRVVEWRRAGDVVTRHQARFLNWFLVRDPQLLADLPSTTLAPEDLAGPLPALPTGLGLVHLRGNNPFRYLALTDRLPELEPAILDVHAKRSGEHPRSLSGLGGEVYWRPPAEQYLAITGHTYFKGMSYADVRRLQFDLETTGLDEKRDRIFMISMSDSTGFRTCLDTAEMSERELLEQFVTLVQQQDPDVLENHNIFEFDIPFLIQRASALGVDLALGRDRGGFSRSPDQVKVGERSDPFTRYSLAGREIVDTLHAVKRYGAIVRDMRYHGLKQAARYFGVARIDREYVHGPEIWNTFQVDPERVRRYACDDVAEVDELSKLLLAPAFALASMVPKPYERIATAGTGQGLIEPLLVRAYLANGHAVPDGQEIGGGAYPGGKTELFTSGIVRHVVKADVASLYPSLMLRHGIAPRTDGLGCFLAILAELTRLRLQHKAEARKHPSGSHQRLYHDALQGAMKVLINSFYGSLGAGFALFADRDAAAEVTRRGREVLDRLLAELERRGVQLIEADTDGVFFSVPPGWAETDETRLIAEVGAALETEAAAAGAAPAENGARISIELDGRYQAMYSYAEKNYVLLEYGGGLRIVGGAFRSSKFERYAERFLAEAAALLLADQPAALRDLYRDYVRQLREGQVPIEDLCVSVRLTKSPEQYRKAKRKEEQYEVLLAAGRYDWKPGQRVAYYRARGGAKRLIEEYRDDYDAEHYVARLRTVALQRLSKALREEDLRILLSDEPSLLEEDLGAIRTISTREARTERRELALESR
jgi:DNA polymerase elongation subunit (family B)